MELEVVGLPHPRLSSCPVECCSWRSSVVVGRWAFHAHWVFSSPAQATHKLAERTVFFNHRIILFNCHLIFTVIFFFVNWDISPYIVKINDNGTSFLQSKTVANCLAGKERWPLGAFILSRTGIVTGAETGTRTMVDNRSQPMSWFRCNVKGSAQFHTIYLFLVSVPISVQASVNTPLWMYSPLLNRVYFVVQYLSKTWVVRRGRHSPVGYGAVRFDLTRWPRYDSQWGTGRGRGRLGSVKRTENQERNRMLGLVSCCAG